VLFRVKKGKFSEETKEFVKEVLKEGAKVLKKLKGIPVPENVFDLLFKRTDKVEDIFAYLEEYFEGIVKEGWRPVLVIDELQVIRKVINATGQLVLDRLFNFMVRLTKETHLCHCLCATSDCLFIEDVYRNARLEGRARYLLVDDLDKETAFGVYEKFGFKNKELVWEYIGGKLGDMVRLYERKKQGYNEEESLEEMLRDETGRLKNLLKDIKYVPIIVRVRGKEIQIKEEDVRKGLEVFLKKEEVVEDEIERPVLLGCIEENILFFNPLTGTVRPQGRLLWRAIREVNSEQ
jgi:AAA+ ATPase superfamily predicted ATPase